MFLKKSKNLLDIKTRMRGYFSIGFIDFMFAGKTLIDFTSLLSPYGFEKK